MVTPGPTTRKDKQMLIVLHIVLRVSVAILRNIFSSAFLCNDRRFDLGFRATSIPISAGHPGPNVSRRQVPKCEERPAPARLCYLTRSFRRKPQARQSLYRQHLAARTFFSVHACLTVILWMSSPALAQWPSVSSI